MAIQVPPLAIYQNLSPAKLCKRGSKEREMLIVRDRSGAEVQLSNCAFMNTCKEVATPVYVVFSICRLLGQA